MKDFFGAGWLLLAVLVTLGVVDPWNGGPESVEISTL